MAESMINLEVLTSPAIDTLIGRPRGEAARAEFKLDVLDVDASAVAVYAPKYLRAITPSFVQGLFGPSVRALGGREGFLAHYKLDGLNEALRQDILEGISRTLISREVAGGHRH